MKTALLPATRVEPALRKEIEAVLEEGETLSAFIEASVRRQAEVREAQRAFIARGLAAERRSERAGDWLDAKDVLAHVRSALGPARRRRAKR
jgi:hypothetical protein